ncbi:MAG: aspartate aminotransferase family protein [Methylocystaceae bacterium]
MHNQEIIAQGEKYVMNTYNRFPLAVVSGKGCRVKDADGKDYLDFGSGIAVTSLGHAPDELVSALTTQAEQLWHCSNLYWIEPQVTLAEKLVKASGLGKAFFCNSGAEANEAAIKLARKYFFRQEKDRYEIISFHHSFHGRTLGSLAATGQDKYHQGFAPMTPGFVRAEYNNLDSVKQAITKHTAAIIVEVVQGEGGVHPANPEFLFGLRELCDTEQIILIFDEVQTGMGRTGTLFAGEQYGIQPDIITLAKALGGGYPLAAMLASDKVASGFAPGDHASTFGGNPLGCAVANKVIDTMTAPGFLSQVQERAAYLQTQLEQLAKVSKHFVEVRGLGMLLAVQLSCPAAPVVKACLEQGMLILSAGIDIIRVAPPLVISHQEIDEGVAILAATLTQFDQ